MKKSLIILLLLFIYVNNFAQKFPSNISSKNLTYKLIECAGKTWGYDIYNNGKLMIHQPSIPAMPGNEGFKTKAAAEKVAKKVIEKICNGENPPVVSIAEMGKWGVIPK